MTRGYHVIVDSCLARLIMHLLALLHILYKVPHRSAGHATPPVKVLRSASLPFSEPAFYCAAMKRRHRLSSGEQSKHLCSFGKKGHKPGNLNTPTGIAVTKTGKMHCVYICKETWSVVHHSDIGCFDSI